VTLTLVLSKLAIRRLRADSFSVVERARPRRAPDSLGINHGRVVIAAVPGVRLSVVDVGFQPSTLELVTTRVVSGTASCIVAVIYRPGSVAVTASFFTEFADLLDRLSTYVEPLIQHPAGINRQSGSRQLPRHFELSRPIPASRRPHP